MRKAVLAAVKLDGNRFFEETIAECIELCKASYIDVVATVVQSANSLDPHTAFRKGKVEELKAVVSETEADMVVFYNNLTLSMTVALEEYLETDIIDRTNLILDIFESRASSREAKLQTEMARLKYSLPSKLKDYIDEDRGRGGGVNNRGSGETRASVLKKGIGRRISFLRRELEELRKAGEEKSVLRNKSSLKKVALVGYTNAGKSSLMNLLLSLNEREDKQVLAKNQLFATLDTSVRRVSINGHDFLLSDTVGFVSDLPHDLVEAFNSTLKAAKDADLLIHVMDCSNPYYQLQKATTLDTLKMIEADSIPMIDVYNKCDLIDKSEQSGGLYISCKNSEGLDELFARIIKELYPDELTMKVLIPYSSLGLMKSFKDRLLFDHLEDDDEGSWYLVKGKKEDLDVLRNRIVPLS